MKKRSAIEILELLKRYGKKIDFDDSLKYLTNEEIINFEEEIRELGYLTSSRPESDYKFVLRVCLDSETELKIIFDVYDDGVYVFNRAVLEEELL